MTPRPQRVTVEGRTLTLTNLDKVLYPATGTTKGEVLHYLAQVADVLVPHAAHRPATRKRWPDGVEGQSFFQKNLDASTPDWVPRHTIRHRHSVNDYVLVDDLATLTWLGQTATLEIHVPQWRFGRTGDPLPPDRLVLDLDPGPGVGLAECVRVGRWARDVLAGMDLELLPVTSGSKGLHLYAPLTGRHGRLTSDDVSAVAKELARHLATEHPDHVVAEMKRSLRAGKVFVDWSQNNGSKTTITPYSLRGRERPTVAAPRTWDELDDPAVGQLTYPEVLERVARDGDLLAPLLAGHLDRLEPTPEHLATFDRLETYRARRDPGRTPEPFDPEAPRPAGAAPRFVIQEHHARRLHWDFRLEHEGVLVSWALPRGEPTDPAQNHLAVQTEDHPLAYGDFEGTIPAGEYGGGEVTIWDSGTYDLEKWRDAEVIVTLHGRRHGSRRLALIRTGGRGGDDRTSWLIHRTKAQPGDTAPTTTDPAPSPAAPAGRAVTAPRPMLATSASEAELARLDPDEWAFEAKWDGFRTIVEVLPPGDGTPDDRVRLTSRSGRDLTPTFPELQALAGMVRAEDLPLVLDGEVVALDDDGRPSFRRLQQRANLSSPREVDRARRRVGVDLVLFDVLHVGGTDLTEHAYDDRRTALARALSPRPPVHVPAALEGTAEAAMAESRRLGLEGLVAKRRRAGYAAGHRSREWRKVKHAPTQEAVVIGWRPLRVGTPTEDPRSVGALLLALPAADDGWRYVGRVGTGFSDRVRRELAERLAARERPTPPADDVPAADAAGTRWVSPAEVVEVRHTGWTGDAPGEGSLRHAVWRGVRGDKDPRAVRVE